MYQLLIKNANIIDGSGKKPFIGDVAIESGKIVSVQATISTSAKTTVDAKKMVLAPGFIDSQNHSDSYWQLFSNPGLHSLIAQGYTTLLVGSSGTSLAPLISNESLRSVQKWQSTSGLNVNWRSFKEYTDQLSIMKFGSNIVSLVGYSTIRRGLLGDSIHPPTQAELETLLSVLDTSFQEGAVGVSVGLQYSHELNITDVELVAIAELCAKRGKLLAASLRNEDVNVINSARELTALAEQTGVNLKVSHLKIRHKSNWPLLTELLDSFESAYHRGAKVHFDCYPYTYTWQPLYTFLPNWSLEGGRTHLLERLNNEETRKRILSSLTNHPANLAALIIASTANGLKVNGKTISQIAQSMSMTSEEAILNLIKNGGATTLVFDESLDMGTVMILCNHSLSFIGTNGGGFDLPHGDKLVHPRSFGTAPKFLRQVIDSKSISLEEGIAKLTSRVAKTIGLKSKGLIASEYDADLVLFDPTKIDSKASVANPYQFPIGIEGVWINGEKVVQKGVPTGTLEGKYLKS